MTSHARLLRFRAAAVVVTALAVLGVAAAGASGGSTQATRSIDLPADATLVGWYTRAARTRARPQPKPTTTTVATSTTAAPTTTAPTTTVPAPTTTTGAPTTTTAPAPPGGGGASLFSDGFETATPAVPWLDDSHVGGWTSTYNGYGVNNVELDGSRVLSESPMISTRASDTHASLVVTSNAFGDFDATVRMKTVSQLRI